MKRLVCAALKGSKLSAKKALPVFLIIFSLLLSSCAAPAAEPYGAQTEDTVLCVSGSALERSWFFTLAELQDLGGYIEDDYFSRGKQPQEETNRFCGISVSFLLESVCGLSDYKKAAFSASDGYSASYSRSGVNADYLDETQPEKALSMILAWSCDGSPCSLTLVMGQSVEGEYNRTYWVRDVAAIDVSA